MLYETQWIGSLVVIVIVTSLYRRNLMLYNKNRLKKKNTEHTEIKYQIYAKVQTHFVLAIDTINWNKVQVCIDDTIYYTGSRCSARMHFHLWSIFELLLNVKCMWQTIEIQTRQKKKSGLRTRARNEWIGRSHGPIWAAIRVQCTIHVWWWCEQCVSVMLIVIVARTRTRNLSWFFLIFFSFAFCYHDHRFVVVAFYLTPFIHLPRLISIIKIIINKMFTFDTHDVDEN